MLSIQIPKPFLSGFQSLAQISAAQAKQVANFLEQISVGTGGDTFEKMFDEKFIDLANTGIASTIFSLASFTTSELNNLSDGELGEALTQSYSEQTGTKDEAHLQQLKKNLLLIFEKLGRLSSSYKVFGLLSENSRTFKNCRIVSDIRLVFNDDLADKNRNALIVHRLKINAVENDEKKEYFFSLDTNDLKKLKEQIERAEEKDKLIREQYAETISFITVTE